MRRTYTVLCCLLVLFVWVGCRKVFEHGAISDSTSLLVVEGIINPSGQTNIYLSRSQKLSELGVAKVEKGAKLQVEGTNNEIFTLTESQAGVYSLPPSNFKTGQQYRLRIKTAAGNEYLSELMPVRTSPPIDSVIWKLENDGVGIYVNAHDNNNNTRYYQWDFIETWQQRSVKYSEFIYKNGAVQARDYNEQLRLFNCWGNAISSNILIASTTKLSADVVHQFPLTRIPNLSEKLGIRYSILVKQYAIGKEAYEYLSLMKKNSELQGSLFDNQPSEIVGNIKSLSNPEELVIGFINISPVVEKRIFIEKNQVPDWIFSMSCGSIVIRNNKDSLENAFSSGLNLISDYNLSPAGTIQSYNGDNAACLDCRTRGGSSTKPAFW